MTAIADLVAGGFVSPERAPELARVAQRYVVAITPAMAALINRDAPDDPIARQFIPDARELTTLAGEVDDPIGDHAKSPLPGLVHRYLDRVLIKLSGVCPVYCRFCFRREMVGPGAGTTLSGAEIAACLDYVRTRPEIFEVILTGGDPLILSPRRIAEVTAGLGGIGHVRVLRWHTRVPVVAPERVTPDLVGALKGHGPAVYVAIHANHPRELTPSAVAALGRLADAGIVLVSQTVLLKGVNDTADTLEALMRAFVGARVTPYYLHHGDLAPGTAHFRTTIAAGQAIMATLRARLSGIAQPTYVLDIPGAHGKVPIGPGYVAVQPDGSYLVTDGQGAPHAYRDSVAVGAADDR
jgi:lysine 2,3-aminomutase